MYSGWATDAETRRVMYFSGGKFTVGSLRMDDSIYYFENNGLGAEGTYNFDGVSCAFGKGQFVSSPDGNVVTAGWAGEAVHFVLHNVIPTTVRCLGEYIASK